VVEFAMAKPLVTITGASHGIGRALAQTFACEGHALLLIARHEQEIEGFRAVPHRWAEVDVAEYAHLKAAVDDAEEAFGPTDCLVVVVPDGWLVCGGVGLLSPMVFIVSL
jgi:NADP-dependent 3-hydroxy acid dehydrogenase YdfG